MAIYDTMQFVRPSINTLCLGMAASMGAVLLAAGEPGRRAILPHARVMIHQPLGGARGQSRDVEIMAAELVRTRHELNQILSHHTGQPVDRIERDTDRDNYMIAKDAVEYGLVDRILEKRGLDTLARKPS
jgi:ATP-dependent Clp protease protease subunit